MSISYQVRRFDERIVGAYTRLFPEREPSQIAEQLRWRYADNPAGCGHFSTAEDDGEIVGMIALIPTTLSLGSSEVSAVQAVDTVVDPQYRGKGLFTGMGLAAQQQFEMHGGSAIWGFPNQSAAKGWFGKMGWQHFGEVPLLIRPLRTGFFLRRINESLGKVNLPLMRGSSSPDPNDSLISRFDGRFDKLLANFSKSVGCGQVRSVDWLNWRLLRHPQTPYRCVGLTGPDGSIDAMVANVRVEKHRANILYIMEALCRDGGEEGLAGLLKRELARAYQAGAEVAFAWCPPNAVNRAAYRKAGFISLPERLRPITIYLGAKALAAGGAAAEDARAWYISYLDSDTV